MKLLDSLAVNSPGRSSRIELYRGDLSYVPTERWADLLIVSAFPNDYMPTPTSLIGALSHRGVSVADLARDKEVDLRAAFSCWLSRELRANPPGVPYRRVLCFEPLLRGRPPELVGDIFRALAPFLAGPPAIETVAMPIVTAGDQGFPMDVILTTLLEAAIHWMRAGMPLAALKIVVGPRSSEDEARRVFRDAREKWDVSPPEKASRDMDVFISYAREDSRAADILASHLSSRGLAIFMDRQVLKEGTAWQPHIFEAIDRCGKLVAIYSPAYIESKVCQEEFNIAWARGRSLDKVTIFPIYWRSAQLPTYMSMLVHADSREQKEDLLEQVSERLVRACAS